jgi:hypothetical protein
MKLKLGSASGKRVDSSGILYVLAFKVDGVDVVKIGVTCRPYVEERVCEILTSIWKRYRVFPECYVKRFKKVPDVYQKETKLLKQFADKAFTPAHTFTGSTELVTATLEEVTAAYDELTAGIESIPEVDTIA